MMSLAKLSMCGAAVAVTTKRSAAPKEDKKKHAPLLPRDSQRPILQEKAEKGSKAPLLPRDSQRPNNGKMGDDDDDVDDATSPKVGF